MKKRILFVDDDAFLLAGLERLLRSCRSEWDMKFVNGPESALQALSEGTFDVVVSDMRMPSMTGAELLTKVRDKFPNTVRIILSGQSDEEEVFRCLSPAHQYLLKPCSGPELKRAIARACRIHAVLSGDSVCKIVAKIGDLPIMPEHAIELVSILQAADAEMTAVADALAQNPVLNKTILRIANSPYFGLPDQISNAVEAAATLGLDHFRPVVLAASVLSPLCESRKLNFCSASMIDHGLIVAAYAKKIMDLGNSEAESVEYAMIGGLLHDIGKLLLMQRFPEHYAKTIALSKVNKIPIWKSEREIFGATHPEVGAYWLESWGFPTPVLEAVAFHHQPRMLQATEFCPLTAVHVATAWANQVAPTEYDFPISIDHEFIDACAGKEGSVQEWEQSVGLAATT